jgi:putative DNA primase/helicase
MNPRTSDSGGRTVQAAGGGNGTIWNSYRTDFPRCLPQRRTRSGRSSSSRARRTQTHLSLMGWWRPATRVALPSSRKTGSRTNPNGPTASRFSSTGATSSSCRTTTSQVGSTRSASRALSSFAARIRIVQLPGLPSKGDVSDWLAAGGTADQLNQLADTAPVFQPHLQDGTGDHRATSEEQPARLNIGSDVEIARRVIEDLRGKYGEIIYCEGMFWHFNETHWMAIPDEALRLAIYRYGGVIFVTPEDKLQATKLNRARIDSILACMQPALVDEDFFTTSAIGVNCLSGLISFNDAGEPALVPHSPSHRCRHVVPAHWPAPPSEERAAASLFKRLLDGCFRDNEDKANKIALLAEVAAAAILGCATTLPSPKALVLLGPTAENGKSQLLDLLRCLLPPNAVSSISPGRFSDRTFSCHLVAKLLNAPDELADGDAIASEAFKQIVTGEPITVRDVYRSAFVFRPMAQHVFATNTLPTFRGGMDRGVRRRLMVLTCNRIIPPEERIEHIGRRVGAEEADRVLAWAVHGAGRLLRNKCFMEPASSVDAFREWALSGDPVLSWLNSDVVEFRQNDFVPKVKTSEAYANFRVWATDEGYRTDALPAINGFSQRVIAAGAEKGITKIRTAKGAFFVGLASKTPPSPWGGR